MSTPTTSRKKRARKPRENFGAIRQRSSGRYQASYVGPDGNRYNAPGTFDTMTDARAWLAKRRVELDEGTWSPIEASHAAIAKKHRADSFGVYAEEWIVTRVNRHGDGLKPGTQVEYRRLLAGPLAPFGDERLIAITPAMVRTWNAGELARGTKTQTGRAYSLLKSILSTAVQDGRIPTNPCMIRGAANAKTGRKVEPPTEAELAVIVSTIAPRYRAMILVAAWGGLRYGELTELRRKDVRVILEMNGDVADIVVYVERAVSNTPSLGFIIGTPKSEAGVRSVTLPPMIWADVLAHLDEHTEPSPESLLWPASDGATHLRQSTFTKHWYPARRAAGREDMPFHALRHFGATRYALAGATLREIQTRIGHSTVSAAMRYQHATGRDSELARRMGKP